MFIRQAPVARLVAPAVIVVLAFAVWAAARAEASPPDRGRHASPRTTLGILFPLFRGTGANAIISEARALGVDTVRLSDDVFVPGVRPAFETLRAARMRLLFTANHRQLPDAQGRRPAHPPVGRRELATYRQQLGAELDELRPAYLQVENEEVEPRFFAGTMAQYVDELNAAVTVGHARGIPVTNGGITTRPLALLTWQEYRDRGLQARAEEFARRAFSRASDRATRQDLLRKPFTGLRRQTLQRAWDKAKELIPAFRRSRMDYVNFHWYVDDDRALREAVRYLRRATGKPVVTTEIGQHNTEPSVVTRHLQTTIAQLRLPLVIWFDFDGTPALGLHSAPGVLRPNGEAFRRWVTIHRRLLSP
jgi:Glycosyl hydrolase catalytic core